MASILVLFSIVYLVPIVLNILSRKAATTSSGSIYDFVMTPTRTISVIGIIVSGIFLIFIVLSFISGQFRGATAIGATALFFLGVILILAPVKGFWDTTVYDNDITASRIWIIKEHVNISDIDYCQRVKGGIQVYVKGKGEKALSIDDMCTNFSTFEERMEVEGVEIRPYKKR